MSNLLYPVDEKDKRIQELEEQTAIGWTKVAERISAAEAHAQDAERERDVARSEREKAESDRDDYRESAALDRAELAEAIAEMSAAAEDHDRIVAALVAERDELVGVVNRDTDAMTEAHKRILELELERDKLRKERATAQSFVWNLLHNPETQWPRVRAQAIAETKERAKLAEARAVLKLAEWAEPRHGSPFCPACRVVQQSGHAPDCRLRLALEGQ